MNLRQMDIEDEFDAEGNPTPDFLSRIIQAIAHEYEDRATDPEAYISTELTPENCVLGSREMVRLLQHVSKWNTDIRERFLRCVDAVCKVSTFGGLPTEDQLPPMGGAETYDMACAAREMNDDWYDFATHAVFLEDSNGTREFRCVLRPFDLINIQKHPSEYAIITVFPN